MGAQLQVSVGLTFIKVHNNKEIMVSRRRQDIMDTCPEGFEEDLKDFIDEIEGEINTAKDHMEVSSLSDLDRIDEARDMLVDLADSLY